MKPRRRSFRTLLLLVASIGWLPAHADVVSDEDVKLALVYKIARFVTWPDSNAASEEPFRLCVAENDRYERAKDRLSGRKIRDRAIQVIFLDAIDGELRSSCDIFYLAGVRKDRSSRLLARASDTPVLTVSDSPEFVQSGGMIGLSKRGKKISMQINVGAYESTGLIISSQLLELAELFNDNRRAMR